jgi:hypothetical protein
VEHLSVANEKDGSCSTWNNRAEIEQLTVSIAAGMGGREIVTVPRGTACDEGPSESVIDVAYVPCGTTGSSIATEFAQESFVPRETACTSIRTLLNFRHNRELGEI